MTLDCFETAKNCLACAKERISLSQRRKDIVLFPAEGPLEYVAIDILGPLPKTREGNQYILDICDIFSKLVVAVSLKTISTLEVAKAFCVRWIFTYENS
jgi:hypothetical protein